METKIIGIVLLICAALIFQYSYDDFIDVFFAPSVKLKTTIEKDINKAIEVQASQSILNIHHVKFSYRSKDAYEFLKKHPPQIQTSDKGTIWLEVEVLDLQDEATPGFITQVSVFDLKTKNKISEFGETYYMKDFDKNINLEIPTKKADSKEVELKNEKVPAEMASLVPTTKVESKIQPLNSEKEKPTELKK
jgi:hypothetical protein